MTGAGDRAFAAGADISELTRSTRPARSGSRTAGRLSSARSSGWESPRSPLSTGSLGGGCEMAMACTLRIASETAQFGQPEIDLGLVPGFGGSQRLVRLVGRGRALALLLGGHRIGASEAERIGLVNKVVPAAELRRPTRWPADDLRPRRRLRFATFSTPCIPAPTSRCRRRNELEAMLFGLSAATAD